MRMIVFFDLPQKTKYDKEQYRKLIKVLKYNGFIMIQYSVYSKLCLNSFVAKKTKNGLERFTPKKGDVRYLIISEKQYQSIRSINNSYTIKEKVINRKRLLIIGGNNEDS